MSASGWPIEYLGAGPGPNIGFHAPTPAEALRKLSAMPRKRKASSSAARPATTRRRQNPSRVSPRGHPSGPNPSSPRPLTGITAQAGTSPRTTDVPSTSSEAPPQALPAMVVSPSAAATEPVASEDASLHDLATVVASLSTDATASDPVAVPAGATRSAGLRGARRKRTVARGHALRRDSLSPSEYRASDESSHGPQVTSSFNSGVTLESC